MPEITRGERYLSYSMYCSLKLCRRMLTRADYWQYFFANDRNNTWGDVLKLQYVLQSQTLQKDAGTCRVLAVFFANDKITRGEMYLTLRRLMSYIYGAPILDVSRSHTTTQHSR